MYIGTNYFIWYDIKIVPPRTLRLLRGRFQPELIDFYEIQFFATQDAVEDRVFNEYFERLISAVFNIILGVV